MAVAEKNILAELVLSPEGHVYLAYDGVACEGLPEQVFDRIQLLFAEGAAAGLLHLGIEEFAAALPPSFYFWQTFSRRFITDLCKLSSADDGHTLPDLPAPPKAELDGIVSQALLLKGFEYLTADVLIEIWHSLTATMAQRLELQGISAQEYLKLYNPRWNLVGRVCFHLAENKKDEHKPFAFLATYTTHLSHNATAQHLPLKRALLDYAGDKNNAALLALLLPVQKAAEKSPFIKGLIDSGELFHTLTWTPHQAHKFLQQIPLMESSGIMVRVPNWWNSQKPPRPRVVVKVGEQSKGLLGLNTLLDFDMQLTLNEGETLTRSEWEKLLNAAGDGDLVKIKGQWVEVDQKKLQAVLQHWDALKAGARDGLSMAEGLRLLAGGGADLLGNGDDSTDQTAIAAAEWSTVVAGDWLNTVLTELRNPQASEERSIGNILKHHLQATLRPYQAAGVQWLWLLYQLGLGGCLADDMGLGKTIQVLALLLLIQQGHRSSAAEAGAATAGTSAVRKPHLLVVPASLLGNWQAEAERFAPSLKLLIAHCSSTSRDMLAAVSADALVSADIDLVMTTYAYIHRLDWLKQVEWDLLILDEAQLIKNPATKQTRAVKTLKSSVRFTLTGTPIENRLGDLWSLFDFTSPGLLGTSKAFSAYAKNSGKEGDAARYSRFVAALRSLTQPYILRRLKSDKKIISDLPDKTEMQTYCSLSKEQIQLYQQAVKELERQLEEAEGIHRRGLVLSYLMRFKQICNHPAQWLGYGEYRLEASGKFQRLQELCEEIAAKQEKVLVFTQFREIIPALCTLLTAVFGREGLQLHGDTPIKERAELVDSFQQELGPPFFVLSLKAGGTGLNLTKASHVIHFDRGWNPAVENQATDRAYRIGQKHPVLVHKFICRGTIETKIDALISSKKALSQEILQNGSEMALTELTNEQLMDMISLDIKQALGDQ